MVQRDEGPGGRRAHSSTSSKPGAELDPAELPWERPADPAGPGGPDDPADPDGAVEIARLPDGGYAMRNGGAGSQGPILVFTRAEWDAFVRGVRNGEFHEERLA